MRFDEGSPIEFIFGKLPRSLEPRISQIKEPNSPSRLEFEIWWTGLMYGLLTILFVDFIPVSELLSNPSFPVIPFLLYLVSTSLISSIKYYVQFKRYGPDIKDHEHFSFSFLLVQSILSYATAGFLVLGSLIVLPFFTFISPLILSLIGGIIVFMVYSRIMSTLPQNSVGMGIGLIPSIKGMIPFWRNLNTLVNIRGKKDFQLAALRWGYWITIISLSMMSIPLTTVFLVALTYSFASCNLEKQNASSVMMKLRSKIQKMTPSGLPEIKFDPSHSFVLRDKMTPKSIRRRGKLVSDDPGSSVSSPSKEDLAPIAMRSMNRIASSIMSEE
jgi:hypothetical protein